MTACPALAGKQSQILDPGYRIRLWRILFYVANFEEEQRRKQIHQEAE
jgi:hypothetical protein